MLYPPACARLVNYRYLLLDDAPSEAGTPLNKANLLTDATARLVFNTYNTNIATINKMLANLAFNRVFFSYYMGTGTVNNGTSTVSFSPPENGTSDPCTVYIIVATPAGGPTAGAYSGAEIAILRRESTTYLLGTATNLVNYREVVWSGNNTITIKCTGTTDNNSMRYGMNLQGTEYFVLGFRLDED